MLMPVGIDAGYDGAVSLRLRVGPIRKTVFPNQKSTGEADGKTKKKPPTRKKEKKQPDKHFLLSLVRPGLRALNRVRRKLRIDLLRLHFTAAAGDPYDTIRQYRAANLAVYATVPVVERTVCVRQRDIETGFTFEADKPTIFARIIMNIRVGQLCVVGIGFAAEYLKMKRKTNRARRAEERKRHDGKQANRRTDGYCNEQD